MTKKQELQHFIATACMLLTVVFSTTKATAKNGEQQVPLADPFILYDKGVYYAYGTGSDNGIPVYISRDLKNWKSPSGDDKVHLALDKRDSYGNKWFWAPEVYLIDGTYYMYYSAEEHICVATSESPLGPFRQKEKRPMIEGRNIDNSLFIDPNGQAYLFWVKIEKDLQTPRPDTARPCISMSQEWEKVWPSVNEGPFVIRHKGTYYLTYSANSYECPDYGIGYATADHPLGPWTKSEHNPILQSPGTLQGCGHHAVFRDKRHRYRVVFHAHHAPGQISPRIMHLTRLKFIPQKNTADRLVFLPDYFTPRLTRD